MSDESIVRWAASASHDPKRPLKVAVRDYSLDLGTERFLSGMAAVGPLCGLAVFVFSFMPGGLTFSVALCCLPLVIWRVHKNYLERQTQTRLGVLEKEIENATSSPQPRVSRQISKTKALPPPARREEPQSVGWEG